jgi:hypothetical protein
MRLVHSADPTVRILVEDVSDPQIVADVQQVVADLFRVRHVDDQWTVAVAAAEIRGRWDVAVKGPSGTHVLSFAASVRQLPEFVRRYVERTLDRVHT